MQVALQLMEAADLSANDIQARLRTAIKACFKEKGWGFYYVDHFGDAAAGDVIYSSGYEGDLKKAPYTITETSGAAKCEIDTAAAVAVVPRCVYEPVTTPTTEAKKPATEGATLALVESAIAAEEIVLTEAAKADYPVKLIAPGKGSSAFYPAEVLKRDGPGVFKAGTHMYVNHPTAAEEAARPEGDWKNLAAVLTEDATYQENGAKGPGLYSRMKVFSDHGAAISEKAPYSGVSIRAAGIAESGRTRDGLPILKTLTHAESVDIVTRAGAGGLILTEAAKAANTTTEGESMNEADVKKLIETQIGTAVKPYQQRAIKGDAREEASQVLKTITLPEAAKLKITEAALVNLPTTAEGELDTKAFREALAASAKAEGEYLAGITGSGRVFGMGTSAAAPVELTEAQRGEREKQDFADTVNVFESLGMPKAAAELAAKGRAN